MKRDYPRLPIEQFGVQMLETGDLDPIYIALHKCELDYSQLCRWLVAYWCLYHAGSACWLSERSDEEFWQALAVAAANVTPAPTGERWPRGAERRHWRGGQAIASAEELINRGQTPEQLVGWVARVDFDVLQPIPFENVRERALALRGFGDWIAFKMGDMIDRLNIRSVDFETAQVFMFADPRKAALMLAKQKLELPDNAKLKDENFAIAQVVDYLTHTFKDHTAPPLHERSVGLQEVETILCKWKSHMNGHYPVGKDIHEISSGLTPWAQHSDTAALFNACLPRMPS